MKKIFAISVLSIMAVVSSNAWATSDTDIGWAYGIGSSANNYNIATVDYVKRNAVPSVGHSPDSIVTTNTYGDVQFVSAIDQDQVSGLADALDDKVDDTQVVPAEGSAFVATYTKTVQSGGAVEAEGDTFVPSLNAVAQNFVPNIATTVYNRGEETNVNPAELPNGAYSLIVEVEDGKISYRWVAMTLGSGSGNQIGCDTSAGSFCAE